MNDIKRSPILIIASGAQDIGKSYTSLKHAIYYAYITKHKRSTLIFDKNGNEFAEYEIDGIKHRIKPIGNSVRDVIAFGNSGMIKPEVRRISPIHSNGFPFTSEETEDLLRMCINFYRGGTLILEDFTTMFDGNIPNSIKGLLTNVRHRNCDVCLHLQSIARISPIMRQNTKIIRYHYQMDSILDSKEDLRGELDIYLIAEKLINKQFELGNTRFFVYIYRMSKKLKGDFSPRMLSEAIQEYISENERIIRPLLVKRNIQGKKIHNYETALNLKTKELFIKYWGNELK